MPRNLPHEVHCLSHICLLLIELPHARTPKAGHVSGSDKPGSEIEIEVRWGEQEVR